MQQVAKRTVVGPKEQTETTEALTQLVGEYRSMARSWLKSWTEIASSNSFAQDLMAGVTVAAVAIPLNLGLAVTCGLPPIAGLVAGAIGGGLAAIFGGARLQVTGPAAALSSMVLALALKNGAAGVAAATVVVGIVSLVLAFVSGGRIAKFVPESVLGGFTTGVGLTLLDQQLPDLLGFHYEIARIKDMMSIPGWLHQASWISMLTGLFVMFLVVSTKNYKRFPAAIVGIGLVTFLSVYLKWNITRVGAVPSKFPPLAFPNVPEEKWFEILAAGIPLGLLASVESLLSARAIDRMAQAKEPHNSNLELFGQGVANVFTGLFGGMPVTGVVVRSGVNVQSGAKTRLSALIHALILAACVLFLSRFIAEVPLSALAGLLCVVGFRLIELGTLIHLVKREKIEAVAFLVAAAGTVSGHLMWGILGGLAIHFAGRQIHLWMHPEDHVDDAEIAARRARGIRASLGKDRAQARMPGHHEAAPDHHGWLRHIREQPQVPKSAFVHEQATLIGRVVLGDHVHVAAGSSVRADEGTPFFIGPNSNIQDGVVIHALKERRVLVGGEEWAVYVGKNVSIAHDALVHGPCYVGDDTFIGFKAVVHDSVVGAGCFIGMGAIVVGVEIPDGKLVPHGRIVDSADAVDALPDVGEAHRHFNEDVVDVNRGLAVAYRRRELVAELREAGERDERPRRPPVWEAQWEPSKDPNRF